MPDFKYSSVPLEEGGTASSHTKSSRNYDDEENIIRKRLPFCIGICILLAIVYVLSRSSSPSSLETTSLEIPDNVGEYEADALRKGCDFNLIREERLENSVPHIIECAEAGEGGSQNACHLSREKRYQSLGQRAATLWMTGLSGSGKSTIAKALEEELVLRYHKHVYRLDGDNIRTGLNRDLGFSKEERGESVRRVGELSCLFTDSGTITIVSLVSPYREARDKVRKRHEEQGLKFMEVFMDVPLDVVQERDPKGLYEKVAKGEIKGFTGVDAPYEAPLNPEIRLPNYEMTIEECVSELIRHLKAAGVLMDDMGARMEVASSSKPDDYHYSSSSSSSSSSYVSTNNNYNTGSTYNNNNNNNYNSGSSSSYVANNNYNTGSSSSSSSGSNSYYSGASSSSNSGSSSSYSGSTSSYSYGSGLLSPDGGEVIDLLVPPEQVASKRAEAATLSKALLTDIDINWLQVIAEGWAAPLKGFMREGALLQAMHFNSLLIDPTDSTGNKHLYEEQTDFNNFNGHPPERVSMSVPILLPATDFTKLEFEKSGKNAISLVTKDGKTLAILRNPEIYENRKEEIIARFFGVIDPGHPYIKHIQSGGPWLIGGEIELLERIRYNDGLDQYRFSVKELMAKFKEKGADAVFAFQTRNPTHAGHAYLMRTGRERLLKRGFKNPVLWLSPLGGWTKEDDVPLDVRVLQHQAVLNEGMLDPETTVMAIWPSPMIYAGPTEVIFHAKSRRNAGAGFFVVGRDPAGMKGSSLAVSHPDDDLYNGDHGRYVLQMSPGLNGMEILTFTKVYYDKKTHTMRDKDETRPDDFISISGTKMRALAGQGAKPCGNDIPSDLLAANCIPPGFMVNSGWDIVCDYYMNKDVKRWIPWSRPHVNPDEFRAQLTTFEGEYGQKDFKLYFVTDNGQKISPWHDIIISPNLFNQQNNQYLSADLFNIINFVVEIPMYQTAKMEVNKEEWMNPIMQDISHDKPRYYNFGTTFFNYGLISQTYEDPKNIRNGLGGDNDPLDVIEIGSTPLPMGAVVPVKTLGSLELIDEGETDHKIIGIRLDDPLASRINDMNDLEREKPGIVERLVYWLKFYKTADGKPANKLGNNELPTSKQEAQKIILECHEAWIKLMREKSNPNFYLGGNY